MMKKKYGSKIKIMKKKALEIVKSSSYELENLSDEFKKDKEIVLEAVKQNGTIIQFADDS